MRTDTRDRIIQYIAEHKQARAHDLIGFLHLSGMAVHKQLRRLIAEGILQKAGRPPLVFYILPPETHTISHATAASLSDTQQLPVKLLQPITDNFLSITPDGRLLYGLDGFTDWARIYQPNKSISYLAQEYVRVIDKKHLSMTPEGWIDATVKLKETFHEQYIDRLLYQDIYSYPIFGRTKLAKLVMQAKQSADRALISRISQLAAPVITQIIQAYTIEAVGFIPPTVPRPLQFIDELAAQLQLALPTIPLVKVLAGDIPVPQKTLGTLEERIINARSSIFLKRTIGPTYKKILLIDDVAGSGSSFHETAKKLKAVDIGSELIIAFALVGNIKGYDVVRQI
jgi:hypothetical protein